MKARDAKGRFVKTSGSKSTDRKQTEGGGKYKDSNGRWHKTNGKFA